VFDEFGRDVTIADGLWIITLGTSGWIGYLGKFGLFGMSIIVLAMRQKSYEVSLVTSGLCLVLGANLLDLIPNSGLSPVTWLIAGALMGRVELAKIPQSSGTGYHEVEVANASRYSRRNPAMAAKSRQTTAEKKGRREVRSRYTRQTKINNRSDRADS
jgi:hypothetical protein